MIYLDKIYNQFQKLETAPLVNNQIEIKQELFILLRSILRTDKRCGVLRNDPHNEFPNEFTKYIFVINQEKQMSQIPEALIANIQQAIKVFFLEYSIKTTVEPSNNHWLIDLPSSHPPSAMPVIYSIATCEITSPKLAMYPGYAEITHNLKIIGPKEQIEKLSMTMIEVAEISQEIFRSSNLKSANKK